VHIEKDHKRKNSNSKREIGRTMHHRVNQIDPGAKKQITTKKGTHRVERSGESLEYKLFRSKKKKTNKERGLAGKDRRRDSNHQKVQPSRDKMKT